MQVHDKKKQPTRGNKGTKVHPSQSRHFEKWQLTRRTQRDIMKRKRLKREKLRRVENVVSEAIFGHQWGVQDFWWEECRCFLLPRVLQMNMTGLIQWCEGRTRCPLLFVLPVWILPLSFPRATVSPISQGPGFIKASALLPATFCHIPDNKPEMGLLPDTQGDGCVCVWRKNTQTPTWAATHLWKVAIMARFTRYKHCPHVYMHKRLRTCTLGRSWTISARASFVEIIIEMKAEGWKCRLTGRGEEEHSVRSSNAVR